MKKMRVTTLLILISFVFAILAAILAESALQKQAAAIKAQQKSVQVVVANTVIAAHMTISASMLKIVSIPAGGMNPTALTSIHPIIGKIATQTIYTGEQILPGFLTDRMASSDFADRVPKGHVVISILYNPVIAVGGKIQAGDHVAVIAVLDKKYNATNQYASGIIAANVLVMSMPQLSTTTTSGAQQTGQAINLAVTPGEANRIAYTEVYGQIYIALEPSGSNLPSLPVRVTNTTID